MVDLNLALTDVHTAQVERLAGNFNDLTLFNDLTTAYDYQEDQYRDSSS